MTTVTAALLTWALHLLVVALLCGPGVWLTLRRAAVVPAGAPAPVADRPEDHRDPASPARLLLAVAGAHGAVLVLTTLPRVGPFESLDRNWQGQLLALAFAAGLLLAWPRLTPEGVGLTRPKPGSWTLVAGGALGALVVQYAVGGMGPSAEPTAEAFVNSAVMPGLWEEFLFRGILFSLVLQALPARRRIAGISATWAMLITSLLFALGHGLVVDPVDGLTVQLGYVLSTLVAGIFFVWVRERTGSLLPAIVLHNLINLAGLLVVGLQG